MLRKDTTQFDNRKQQKKNETKRAALFNIRLFYVVLCILQSIYCTLGAFEKTQNLPYTVCIQVWLPLYTFRTKQHQRYQLQKQLFSSTAVSLNGPTRFFSQKSPIHCLADSKLETRVTKK